MTLIFYFTKATNNSFLFKNFYINILTRRQYSTFGSNSCNIQPIPFGLLGALGCLWLVVYNNSLNNSEKAQILKDNQGKAAIYRPPGLACWQAKGELIKLTLRFLPSEKPGQLRIVP